MKHRSANGYSGISRVRHWLRDLRYRAGLAVGGIQEPSSFFGHAEIGRNGEIDTSGHKPAWNPEDNRDRIELISIARQLRKDFAPVGYGISEVSKYIVPKAWRANTGDEEVDSVLNRYIELELEAERFDYSQRHDGPTLWRLSVQDGIIDGDCFNRFVIPRGEQYFMVQPIKGDLIGSLSGDDADMLLQQQSAGKSRQEQPKRSNVGRNKYREIGGALVDNRGRIQWWKKFKEDNTLGTGGYTFDRRLRGRAVTQFMTPDSTDQYRGMSALHDSAKELRDLRVIWDYVRKNMEHGASIAGVVKNEQGVAPLKPKSANRGPRLGPDATTGACTQCNKTPCICPPRTEEVSGVKLVYLKSKEEMEQFKIDNPSANFMDGVKHLLQIGAWSLKMPAGILYDSSGLSGAPMRFELSKAGCSIEDQKTNVVKRLCNPWLRAKILEGIDNGRLPFKRSQLSLLARGKWSFVETPTADEKYRTSSYLQLLDKGAISLHDVCEARGTTFDETLGESSKAAKNIYEAAKQLWEASGKELDITWWIDQLSMRGPNGSAGHLAIESEPIDEPVKPTDDDE